MKIPRLRPSQWTIILITVFFSSVFFLMNDSHPFLGCSKESSISNKDSVSAWKYPSPESIKDDDEGRKIKLGRSIFTETYKYIGPDVKDSLKRFAGNNMDCQNCHFNAGTQQLVLGLVGAYGSYPAFDPRSGKKITLEERVNQCLLRSMNGKMMPVDSPEMSAVMSYLKWLGSEVPRNAKFEGGILPKIKLIDRPADIVNGQNVFNKYCTTCHAEHGEGVLNKPGNVDVAADSLRGYDFPPVYGNDSYNQNAGMYRLLTAAAFIHAKMPLNNAHLNVEEAYDVAAYINSRPRPINTSINTDYPDLKMKPIDSPVPPYADQFPEAQHRFGPYDLMIKDGETNKYVDPVIWK